MNCQAILAVTPLFIIVFILLPIFLGKTLHKNTFLAWLFGFMVINIILGFTYLMLKITELAVWGIVNL